MNPLPIEEMQPFQKAITWVCRKGRRFDRSLLESCHRAYDTCLLYIKALGTYTSPFSILVDFYPPVCNCTFGQTCFDAI